MWSRPARAFATLDIRREWPEQSPGHDEENLRLGELLSPFAQLAQRGFGDLLGRNAEVLIEFFIRPAGAESAHSDEGAVGADQGVPAHADGGFDADFDRRVANDSAAGPARLRHEQP